MDRLRFGLVVERDPLEEWQTCCLENLLATPGVEAGAVLVEIVPGDRSAGADTPLAAAASDVASTVRAMRLPVDLGSRPVVPCPVRGGAEEPLAYAPDAVDRIRGMRLDFVLRFPCRHPEPRLAAATRFGFWSFFFGNEEVGPREPVAFWEVVSGQRTVDAALIRVTHSAGQAVVLRRGTFRARRHSIGATRRRVLEECARWPALACMEILLGNSSRATGPPTSFATGRSPRPTRRDRLAAARAQAIGLLSRISREFIEEKWNVGILDAPVADLLGTTPVPPARWLPERTGDAFLADPIAWVRDGEVAALAERFHYRTAKGSICLLRDLGSAAPPEPRTVLESSDHLSYPYVFEHDGETYCVPECARGRRVILYRADPFPDRWVEDRVLIDGIAAVDGTLFRHEGRWWLLGGNADDEDTTKLYGWYAADLRGAWAPHPLNPLKVDVRSSRPAGPPFRLEGELYRPAQDCSRTYGGAVTLNRVLHLSPTGFEEVPVARVEPERHGPYPDGLHTVSAAGDSTVIDGKRHVFSIRRAWSRLRRRGVHRSASLGLIPFALGFTLASPASGETGLLPGTAFEEIVIDPGNAGDIKLAGDLDGDGFVDLVIGGLPGENLVWYRFPDWKKSRIAVPKFEFTTDGELGDVDGDGDLDVVVPDGQGGDNLVWFENPRPNEDPGGRWPRHVVGAIGSWGKDIELADFDGDGRLDIATRNPVKAMIFFQEPEEGWTRVLLPTGSLGEEGMGSGDLDGDGRVDLVVRGAWLANPGGDTARDGDSWREFAIGPVSSEFKALAVDLNGDGRKEVLFSSSEQTDDVTWWTPEEGDPRGAWSRHVILPSLERAHTLLAGDVDLDGTIDVVVGQMHTSQERRLMVLHNRDGSALHWDVQVVSDVGVHNSVLVDLEGDGDLDVFAANWAGNPPVRIWLNRTDPAREKIALDRWTPIEVSARHRRTFGLAAGDLDGDGDDEIVSGRFVYWNPGGDLGGEWPQRDLPEGMQAFGVLDVDGDARLDVLATRDEGGIAVYWLRVPSASPEDWPSARIGELPRASHALGGQGHWVGELWKGSRTVLLSCGEGIFGFLVPEAASRLDLTDSSALATAWPRFRVHSDPSDEGFAVADIDGDGFLDVVATTGETRRVEWYRNPGAPDSATFWTRFPIGALPDAVYLDRVAAGDLDGDEWPDVVVTEENREPEGAAVVWWKHPGAPGDAGAAGPGVRAWEPHGLTIQGSTNSLDIADLDRDGDLDLVTGEHRGALRVTLWENDGGGGFGERVIDRGRETHLGTLFHDLDHDGDLDLVGIAWDNPQFVRVWRNDAIQLASRRPAAGTGPDSQSPLKRLADRARRAWERLRR